jgi:hypothetical protein
MFDLPEHFPIGVDKNGNGPILEDESQFDHIECWCSNNQCEKYKENNE